MSIRTRRQSQVAAQPPPNPAARAPRKSVGPGMLPMPSLDARQEVPRLASHGDHGQTRVGRTPSFGQGGNRRGTLPPGLILGADATTRVPSATRAAKAKSLHVAPRQQPTLLSAPMAFDSSRSPARSTARAQTPSSSSSKRQSTMHHVSGLGARTISPTDARRLKRLSMNPNALGGPVSPPTPQAEFSFDERAINQSPAMIFRKSVTPSSARATPDQNPNRKSYASGISISSNSSLNSLRVGNTTLQPRNAALTGSRLPTPKPTRNVHSSAGPEEEEEVPPVPAIPKAYESPKDPENKSFSFSASALRSSAALRPSPERTTSDDMASISSLNTQTRGTDSAKKGKATIRHRRGLTVGTESDAEKSPSVQVNKKNLQPMRLPPLNLLPLGTPFNNRISSFPAPSAEVEDRNTTPPPKRAANKTPSTPMTASKASFFSRNLDKYDGGKHLRSSSSAFNLKSTDTSLHGAAAMPIPTLNPNRQVATPFSSNSLPKNSGDYANLFSRPSGEYKLSDTDAEMQNIKVQGPRAPQKDTDSAKTSTSTEPETPSSASSLRRKLSLSGWRRGSSKTTTHVSQTSQPRNVPQTNLEAGPQPPKHGDMPPPKLPASATWSGAVVASPTPATRTRPSLDFTRRKTSASTAVASDTEAEKVRKANGALGIRAASGYSEQPNGQPAPKSNSMLTPMQRMLGSKGSTNMLKARNLDTNLDRDDLAADEEMKKLGSKRKDFEHAARDVDELRKRARPQERVTAAQALQMVSLNIFERGEIIDYKEIYFCGTKSAKKHVGDLNATTANFGYDDDRGDYNIVFGDHLAYRYEVVDLLGKGSFGQVVRCVDHKTGLLVAIKIIRNKKRFHQQALVEVNILQKLREWVSFVFHLYQVRINC
jgi:dual specificity tyrosine-phosphorylation-regulated kinase 2/3/4